MTRYQADQIRRFLEALDSHLDVPVQIGQKLDHDQNLVAAIELLWDTKTADRAEALIEEHRAARR
ncbi:MAG: hypothetical protein PVI30_14250 [Myxococcales bacterium]|jgi:hypothetical protein